MQREGMGKPECRTNGIRTWRCPAVRANPDTGELQRCGALNRNRVVPGQWPRFRCRRCQRIWIIGTLFMPAPEGWSRKVQSLPSDVGMSTSQAEESAIPTTGPVAYKLADMPTHVVEPSSVTGPWRNGEPVTLSMIWDLQSKYGMWWQGVDGIEVTSCELGYGAQMSMTAIADRKQWAAIVRLLGLRPIS